MFKYFYRLLYAKSYYSVAFLAAGAAIIWSVLAYAMRNRRKAWRIINALTAAAFMIIIIYITLISRTEGDYGASLIPFEFLKNAKQEPEAYRSFFFNIVLFYPLGLTMPHALNFSPKKTALTVLTVSAVFSVAVEICQLVFRLGLCETDDVIANVIGAALGFGIWLLYNRISAAKKAE